MTKTIMTTEPRPAIFVDRDGTLIEEVNYLCRVEDLQLFPSTGRAVRSLKDAGYLVIVLTNQSGIGRGIYDEAAMHRIHDAMQAELHGAIDAFYFCPHLPCDGCTCRKPQLGMIHSALKDFQIDMSRSWMVGDKKIDVELAENAGIRSAMVKTGYGSRDSLSLDRPPDILAEDIGEAVTKITDFIRAPA